MEATKVLVKEDGAAIITCPFCRKTTKKSVAHFKEQSKRQLLIKCGCDNIFCLGLEYRRQPRKSVQLLGKSVNWSQHGESKNIIITNISSGGIGFCPFDTHRTKKDDQLQVSFTLNDCNNTPIETAATVRTVGKSYIGCEFNSTESFKSSVGFYLFK